MPRIILDLADDEFLELGAVGYAANMWVSDPNLSAFGRLALKIQEQVDKKATPGQILYLTRMVECVRQAAVDKEVGTMMAKEGFNEVSTAADNLYSEMKKADEN